MLGSSKSADATLVIAPMATTYSGRSGEYCRARSARSRAAGDLSAGESQFCAGALSIDYNRRQVQVDGENVHLTQNEFRIVSLLSANAGKVLTYDFILKELWGPAAKGDNQALRVHMANIRRKIEKNPAEPQYIFTEVGVGYRMIEGE